MSKQFVPTTSNIMSQRTHKKINIEQVINSSLDKYKKLDQGIKYLNNLIDCKAADYIWQSEKIMKQLHKDFQGEELYKPWVRFFDVSAKIKSLYAQKQSKPEELKIFKNGITTLTKQFLDQQIDWRIAKKMLAVKTIFEENAFNIKIEDLYKPILSEIDKALEFLIWKDQAVSKDLTKDILNKLQHHFSNNSEQLNKAIVSGRFDKKDFEFSDTAIMGEDGGMYLLLNNLDHIKEQVIKEIVSSDYLHSKINYKQYKEQIEIGKGGFGTVRFALSLLDSKAKPADIICIKKTKNFAILQKIRDQEQDIQKKLATPFEQVINSTLEDYFTDDIANMVYAPNIFDMALVTGSNNDAHRKGYLMMEVFPQNTATKVFANEKYQKWEYQKPYLLDVFNGTLDLLSNNIVMTDLKPDNTLYDKDTRKATIIDLGGTVKIENKEEIAEFDVSKYSFQSTEGFRAPELEKGIIDMNKALAYTCGKIIEGIIKGGTDQVQVKQIINDLTLKNPQQRLSIKQAIERIKSLGDDSYKETIIYTHYIDKIRERLINDKSSIGINEDIEQTKDLYIKSEVTSLNPYKYANLETQDLSTKIDKFFDKNSDREVMLLLGVAGSGKSIALQLKFMEVIEKWKLGEALPIYFNLASNIDFKKFFESLNNELGTNLKFDNIKESHLYIDSFDEGVGIESRRNTLVKNYIQELGKPKIFISCRTDYLPNDSDYSWFMPQSNKFEHCFIAPINYFDKQKIKHHQFSNDDVVDEVLLMRALGSNKKNGLNYLIEDLIFLN